MRLGTDDTDIRDRIQVRVDPSADPVDWDRTVAQFLLAFVRKQAASIVDAAAAEVGDEGNSDDSNHSR